MSKMTYELSDGLASLARAFEASRDTGVIMSSSSVGQLIDTINSLEGQARLLENEVSCDRWNRAAREERVAS